MHHISETIKLQYIHIQILVHTCANGTEFSRSVLGDIKYILCRRNAGHCFASSGNKPESNMAGLLTKNLNSNLELIFTVHFN